LASSPIRGFDVGLEGICAGERRLVTVPPAWAYGARQVGSIPPDSTLLFEVEALRVATPPPLGADAVFKERESSYADWLVAIVVIGVPVGGAFWGYSRAPKKAKKTASTPKPIQKLAAELAAKKEKAAEALKKQAEPTTPVAKKAEPKKAATEPKKATKKAAKK